MTPMSAATAWRHARRIQKLLPSASVTVHRAGDPFHRYLRVAVKGTLRYAYEVADVKCLVHGKRIATMVSEPGC